MNSFTKSAARLDNDCAFNIDIVKVFSITEKKLFSFKQSYYINAYLLTLIENLLNSPVQYNFSKFLTLRRAVYI